MESDHHHREHTSAVAAAGHHCQMSPPMESENSPPPAVVTSDGDDDDDDETSLPTGEQHLQAHQRQHSNARAPLTCRCCCARGGCPCCTCRLAATANAATHCHHIRNISHRKRQKQPDQSKPTCNSRLERVCGQVCRANCARQRTTTSTCAIISKRAQHAECSQLSEHCCCGRRRAQLVCSGGGCCCCCGACLMRSSFMQEHDYANKWQQQQPKQQHGERSCCQRKQRRRRHQSCESAAQSLALKQQQQQQVETTTPTRVRVRELEGEQREATSGKHKSPDGVDCLRNQQFGPAPAAAAAAVAASSRPAAGNCQQIVASRFAKSYSSGDDENDAGKQEQEQARASPTRDADVDRRKRRENNQEKFSTSETENPGSGRGRNQGDLYCALGGESARCNCAGRRRPTLAGLIELFEQEAGVCCTRAQHDRLTHRSNQQASNQASKSKHQRGNHQLKQPAEMRDIITPVKYEPNEESGTTTTSDDSLAMSQLGDAGEHGGRQPVARVASTTDGRSCRAAAAKSEDDGDDDDDDDDDDDEPEGELELDSLDCSNGQRRRRRCCCARHEMKHLSSSPIERIVSRGAVRVLPSITPAVDADGNQQVASNRGEPTTIDNKLRKKLTKTRWQPPKDARKYELISKANKRPPGRLSTSFTPEIASCQLSPSLSWGAPQIVKHQASSSRRLLKQLARLREEQQVGGSSNSYKAAPKRRPESVARIENLIEQLEQMTREWDEDEHLLDRAERRDFNARLEARAAARQRRDEDEGSRARLEATEHEDLLNFGRRDEITPLEAQSIERSHEGLRRRAEVGANERLAPAAHPNDRRGDDLALRRLTKSPSMWGTRGVNSETSPTGNPSSSYLLCTNANGAQAPIESPGTTKRHPCLRREDDLHYRRIAHSSRQLAPASPELPFGIPRNQSTRQLARLSASERLASRSGSGTSPSACGRGGPQNAPNHFLGHECCDCDNHDDARDQSHPKEVSESRLQPKQEEEEEEEEKAKVHSASTRIRTTQTRTTTLTKMTQTTFEEDHDTSSPLKRWAQPITNETDHTRRSDSRVSFVGDLKGSGGSGSDNEINNQSRNYRRSPLTRGCPSADSGVGGGISPLQLHTPTPTTERTPNAQSHLADYDQDYDPLEVDDLDELELDLITRSPSCDSPPQLERVQAGLGMTPMRRRPRINIDRPRAKSPLLRVGSTRRPLRGVPQAKLAAQSAAGASPKQPQTAAVVIQTYSDSLKRPQHQRRQQSVSEIECQYEFSDEDEAEFSGDKYEARACRLPLKTYESPESSPREEEGDDEAAVSLRLLDSAISGAFEDKDTREAKVGFGLSKPKGPAKGIRPRSRVEKLAGAAAGPRFSIGQYRTLGRRRNLIIL